MAITLDLDTAANGTGATGSYTEQQAGGLQLFARASVTTDAPPSAKLVDSMTISFTGDFSKESLSYTTTAGVTGSYNSATGVLTLTKASGADTDWTAALKAIVYNNTSDTPTGPRTFTVTATDNSTNPATTNTQTATVSVTAVNDAPVNTVPGAQVTAEDVSKEITGLQISDVDAGSGTMTTTLAVTNGTLAVAAISGSATVSGSGTNTVTITGTVAQINATLAAANAVTYNPNANFNGSASLTMTTSDGGNAGTGGTLTDADVVAITVTAVNDAPVNTVPGAQSATEDTAQVITGLAISDGDAGSGTMTTTLAVTNGTLNVATVAGGATISNNGSGSVTLTGTQAQINASLNAAGSAVTYTPAANFNGSATLTMTTSDGNSGSQGTGGALTDVDTVTINVAAVNDAPTGGVTITGGAIKGSTLTAASTLSDPDGMGPVSFSWLRDGVAIGATGSTYKLTQADVGATITVAASYSDAHGTTTVASGATSAVVSGVTRTGTAGNDNLTGSTGDDTFEGSDGTDTVVFSGSFSDYEITVNGSLTTIKDLRAGSPDGVDTVSGVEFIQFADGTRSIESLGGVPCYLPGTLITTMGGAVPIEEIGIGDLVLTVSGEYRPVRWMGRRSYGALFARQNPAVWPVRICAGAISDQVPARDLFISPNHALLLEGVFIEAGLLVNGVSIQTAEPSEDISYINIELDSHDAIFAEGLAAETFLDRDCRSQFQNAAEYATLYPDAIPDPDPIFYARRVEDGATLAHVRDSIEIRAGIRSNTQTTRGPLKGAIDVADHSATSGWVVDVDAPASPVTLEILVNGAPVATVVANRHRADLVNQGDGSGRCSFRFEWPEPLDASVRNIVEVRRLEDAAPLKGPVVIEPTQTASLIPGLREALEEVRLSAERAQLDGTTALLQEAIEQLLQADADAVRKERSSRFWAGSDAEIYKRLVA